MGRRKILLGVMLAVGGILAAVARAENLGEGWAYRRALDFKPALAPVGLAGDNEAWTEFYANGAQKPDGSDVRVTNANRVLVPFRILQSSSSDDFYRIVFATPEGGPYYVWWGNPNAAAPETQLDVQRGVLCEVSRNAGGEPRLAKTAEGLMQMLNRSRPLGAFFVPQIFLGYNPLGDEASDFFHYSSQFHIDKPVTADFSFAVLDSGTLFIDGDPVFHEFRGGWKNKVRESKSVELTAGWHKIEVTQINFGGGAASGVSVVWKRPGEANYSPMPADVFSPIAHADALGLEKIGAAAVADIAVIPNAEAFVPPDGYIQRYTFDAGLPSGMNPRITWDFGDGQIISGLKRQSHDYLAPGVYPVTLRLTSGNNLLVAATRITVKDRLYELFPTPPDDKPRVTQSVLSDYDEKKMSGAAALRGMQFYENIQDDDRMVAWGKAWLASKDPVGSDTLADETETLAGLLIGRKDYANAAACYRLASEKNVGIEQRLTLLQSYITIRCDFFDDATPALEAAMDWRKRISASDANQQRMLAASLVYAGIAQGDAKIAQDALARLGGTDRLAAFNHAQIRQGVLARNIEAYIGTRDFASAQKLIDQWEMEFPESIWDGFTRTLRVKLYAAEALPAVAARIAVEHARANPSGFYAAELLFRAAQNFKSAGEPTQAKAAMDLLVSKYPESPYARSDASPVK